MAKAATGPAAPATSTSRTVTIPADAAGGWMARRLGRLYAEPMWDMRDRVLLAATRNVARAGLRDGYRLDRVLEDRRGAWARLADLSQYGTYDADFKIFDLR